MSKKLSDVDSQINKLFKHTSVIESYEGRIDEIEKQNKSLNKYIENVMNANSRAIDNTQLNNVVDSKIDELKDKLVRLISENHKLVEEN